MPTEQQIQSQVIKYLESIGCYVVKVITSNHSGTPDICACLNGRWISIEMKKPGAKPDPLQLHHLQMVQKAGGLATWASSLNQVQDFLAQHNLVPHIEDEI